MAQQAEEMTFWDHLDALRGVLIRIVALLVLLAVAAFVFIEPIFHDVILWPCRPDFPIYRFIDSIGLTSIVSPEAQGEFQLALINTDLSAQLMLSISTSCYLALILGFPFYIYQLWTFISPGLYDREKRGATKAFFWSNLMFFVGVVVGYFLIFPIILRFLASYKLSDDIANTITIGSYMDNFLMLTLMMGALFELPLLAWLLGKAGILTKRFFKKYRRHAIMVLVVLAAIITPTGDPFTLAIVFVPLYILWECSAMLVPKFEDSKDLS